MARPPKPEGEKYVTPARQFGRVGEDDWNEIKEAVEAAESSLVAWALPTLLAKARREKKRRKENR